MPLLPCIYILKDENYSSFIGEQEERTCNRRQQPDKSEEEEVVEEEEEKKKKKRRGCISYYAIDIDCCCVYQASRISIEEWKLLHGREHFIISSCIVFFVKKEKKKG